MNLNPRSRLALASGGPVPPMTGLRGAISIYVDGRPQFMDELELRTDAEVDHILDVYCNNLGMNQICIGPGFALPYDHHDQPPIDWRAVDTRPLFRKLRARGLHITLAGLPDCLPFFNQAERQEDRAWDWNAVETLRNIYKQLQDEGLVDSVREAWEIIAPSGELCHGVRWLRTIYPQTIPLMWHNPPSGHLNPCASSEGEGRWSWDAFLRAGGNGLDLQSGTPYSRPDALQAMLYDLFDMRRRATGTQGSPWGGPLLTNDGMPMTVRNAEYAAYDITHNHLPWSTAQLYGREGMTVPGPGDNTALDGI